MFETKVGKSPDVAKANKGSGDRQNVVPFIAPGFSFGDVGFVVVLLFVFGQCDARIVGRSF